MSLDNKLYLLTYRSLPIGYQAVQSAHALREFTEQYPIENKQWYQDNNSIIIVTCSNYNEFNKLLDKARGLNLWYAEFREPDIGYRTTAVAFVPNEQVSKLLKHCQLLQPTDSKIDPIFEYISLMKKTPQGSSTVWEHGKQVTSYLEKLIQGKYHDLPRIEKVSWLSAALNSFLPKCTNIFLEDLYTYTLFHDIGKTITHDNNGHYPNHSEASAKIWSSLDSREHIAKWIRNDMAIHTMSQEEFSLIPDRDIHRLVGLAEVYANAEMFGGFDSDSFKIKLKKVIRNGNYN